jgi:hypothetical protein
MTPFPTPTLGTMASAGSSSGGGGRKRPAFVRIKDLSPALADKEVHVKAVVMESNAKDEANASNNATLLVGDDSGCVSLVLPKSVAVHVRLGDVLQLAPTQVVMKGSRLYLWGGKVERVGEFLMLFKESLNVSNLTWVKDPANPDVLVRPPLSLPYLWLKRWQLTEAVAVAGPEPEPRKTPQASQVERRAARPSRSGPYFGR